MAKMKKSEMEEKMSKQNELIETQCLYITNLEKRVQLLEQLTKAYEEKIEIYEKFVENLEKRIA